LFYDHWANGWVDNGEYCKPHKPSISYECFFEPLTWCPLPSESALKAAVENSGKPEHKDDRVIFVDNKDNYFFYPNPRFLKHVLSCSPIPDEKHLFYWRIQAITFFVRPNSRTKESIEKLRKLYFPQQTYPENSISTYVRHGDKYKEMKLYELPSYMDAAEMLVKESNEKLKHTIYLSSDDDKVFQQSKDYKNWEFFYTQETDRGVSHNADKTLFYLLNLNLALEGDAHISTMKSNWNRLIYELASTIGFCAGCPFRELDHPCSSYEECSKKGQSIFETPWR